jgi:hypothetical protein
VKEPDDSGGKAAIDNTRVRVMNVGFLPKRGKSGPPVSLGCDAKLTIGEAERIPSGGALQH